MRASYTRNETRAGLMTEGSTGELHHSAAIAMLNCFASVGASHFDVTLTTRSGEKCGFRRSVLFADLSGVGAKMPLPGLGRGGGGAIWGHSLVCWTPDA